MRCDCETQTTGACGSGPTPRSSCTGRGIPDPAIDGQSARTTQRRVPRSAECTRPGFVGPPRVIGRRYRPTRPPSEAIDASSTGRAANQPPTISTSEPAKKAKPIQFTLSLPPYMWLRLRSAPVASTRVT
jgi:hypothetical protein